MVVVIFIVIANYLIFYCTKLIVNMLDNLRVTVMKSPAKNSFKRQLCADCHLEDTNVSTAGQRDKLSTQHSQFSK